MDAKKFGNPEEYDFDKRKWLHFDIVFVNWSNFLYVGAEECLSRETDATTGLWGKRRVDNRGELEPKWPRCSFLSCPTPTTNPPPSALFSPSGALALCATRCEHGVWETAAHQSKLRDGAARRCSQGPPSPCPS